MLGDIILLEKKTMNLLLGIEYNFTQHANGIPSPPSTGHIYTTSKKINSTLNHSITIPLIFKFNIKTAFIKLGVLTDVNILMIEKGELSTSYYNSTDSITYYSKSNYNDVYFTGSSVGTIAGIGKNFNFLSKKLMLSFNYSFFLNSVVYKRVSNFDVSLGLKF